MLLLLLACAPLYRPGAANAPMFEEAGDLEVRGALGTGGFQGQLAYAPVDHVGVSVAAQGGFAGASRFTQLQLGGGLWAAGNFRSAAGALQGPRAGIWADVGAGGAAGAYSVTIAGSGSTTRFAGRFVQAGLTPYAGIETTYFSAVLSARTAAYRVEHTADSDAAGDIGRMIFVEPTLALRAGAEELKLEVQGGLWLPIFADGTNGVPFPVLLTFGAVWEPKVEAFR